MKLTVAPAGKPDAASAIAELKLPNGVVAIVAVPELPAAIVTADGDEEIAKSADTPPEVVEFSAKPSTTKEVFRPASSVPTRKTWIAGPWKNAPSNEICEYPPP